MEHTVIYVTPTERRAFISEYEAGGWRMTTDCRITTPRKRLVEKRYSHGNDSEGRNLPDTVQKHYVTLNEFVHNELTFTDDPDPEPSPDPLALVRQELGKLKDTDPILWTDETLKQAVVNIIKVLG